jgi:uncharacterized protein YnzC (UPF0291/DUF896 family)
MTNKNSTRMNELMTMRPKRQAVTTTNYQIDQKHQMKKMLHMFKMTNRNHIHHFKVSNSPSQRPLPLSLQMALK